MINESIDKTCKDLAKKVAPMYAAINWKWLEEPVTESMLYEKAKNLMTDLLKEEPLTKKGRGITSIGAGGLRACRYLDEEHNTCYYVCFHVEENIWP